MKNSLYIALFLLLLSCSGVNKAQVANDPTTYFNQTSDKVEAVISLVPEVNNRNVDVMQVKRVSIAAENLKDPYWKGKVLETLKKCKSTEYVLIKYPAGVFEKDFSSELKSAFTELPNLKAVDIGFDTLTRLPAVADEGNSIQAIRVLGNHVQQLPDVAFSSNKLRYLSISCSVGGKWESDWSKCANIETLFLFVNGEVSAPDLSGMKALNQLILQNDQLEKLPAAFFNMPAITNLYLALPRLIELDEQLGGVTTLTSLAVKSYELESLPQSLAKLESLERFSLVSSGKVKTLAPLTKLPKLEFLQIYGQDPFQHLEEFAAMKKLEHLKMSLAQLQNKDLSPLKKLKESKIKRLGFSSKYVVKESGKYVEKSLADPVEVEIYKNLEEIFPKKYFRQ